MFFSLNLKGGVIYSLIGMVIIYLISGCRIPFLNNAVLKNEIRESNCTVTSIVLCNNFKDNRVILSKLEKQKGIVNLQILQPTYKNS